MDRKVHERKRAERLRPARALKKILVSDRRDRDVPNKHRRRLRLHEMSLRHHQSLRRALNFQSGRSALKELAHYRTLAIPSGSEAQMVAAVQQGPQVAARSMARRAAGEHTDSRAAAGLVARSAGNSPNGRYWPEVNQSSNWV
jgi:hypothetical protein